MYSPRIVANRRDQLERDLVDLFPLGLRDYAIDEVKEFRYQRFVDLFDKKGNQTREFTTEESAFILNEQVLSKIDFKYWAERYCAINIAGQTIGNLFPLFESQSLILDQIGRIEEERADSQHPDGIVLDVLKARQLGASTISVAINSHRTTTHGNTFSLIASDVPDNTDFIWDMYERMLDHLPFYLKPAWTERVKNDEIVYTTGTRVFHGASKSTRGADKTAKNASDGTKGNLGRGKTLSVVHQSEIATWTNPSQIDTALEPAIAVSPQTFWLKESTAQGRGTRNWWYNEWQLAKAGKSRAQCIFIPVFAEKQKYSLPAPTGWTPSASTLSVARRYEETGPRWMHKTVKATRDQLWWYEKTRVEKETKGLLAEFLQEYPVDDDEAFQYSGQQVIISTMQMERLKAQARPVGTMIEVLPMRQITAVQRAVQELPTGV